MTRGCWDEYFGHFEVEIIRCGWEMAFECAEGKAVLVAFFFLNLIEEHGG